MDLLQAIDAWLEFVEANRDVWLGIEGDEIAKALALDGSVYVGVFKATLRDALPVTFKSEGEPGSFYPIGKTNLPAHDTVSQVMLVPGDGWVADMLTLRAIAEWQTCSLYGRLLRLALNRSRQR